MFKFCNVFPVQCRIFFIHFSSIFLANLVVLQVYGQEMVIKVRNRSFGIEMVEAAISR